jgi:small redox-active disulfide protein 2
MLNIKILGAGCANCRKLEALAHEAASAMGLEADFVKVTDYADIMKYGIMSTPGLVVNEKVVSSGRMPSVAEISTWLADAQLAEPS